MAYTLAGLRNRVLDDKLGDTSFDPDIVNNFINDTIREIALTFEVPALETLFTGSLPSGGYLFTLPDAYQQVQSLVLSGPNLNPRDISFNYVTAREFNRSYPSPTYRGVGVPYAWTVYGGKLMFDRPTDQTYTLTMFYLRVPTTLASDSAVPELPADFEEAIVTGTHIRILERNEDFDQAQFVRSNDFSLLLDKLSARYGQKQSAKPMMFGRPLNGAGRRKSRA